MLLDQPGRSFYRPSVTRSQFSNQVQGRARASESSLSLVIVNAELAPESLWLALFLSCLLLTRVAAGQTDGFQTFQVCREVAGAGAE